MKGLVKGFLLVLVLVSVQVTMVLADPLVWVTDDTPGGHYIIGSKPGFDREKPGIEIELYQMVAQDLGFEIRFKRMAWTRCLYLIEQNRVDGIFPASFKPARMKIGVFPMADGGVDSSRKTRNNAYYLYKMKQTPLSWDGSQFTNTEGTIGVPLGWAIVDDLKKRDISIQEVTIDKTVPNLLIHGRVQGFICLETVFDAYLDRRPALYGGIVKVDLPIWEKPYYLMLSRAFAAKKPEQAEKIWNAIRDIKRSDRFDQLLKKYVK